MYQQTLRDCWAKEKGAINAWCSIPSAITAEMMSLNDFDSITIDMQHGLVDYQATLNMLQVISGSGKTPMVRVPWNEPGIIMKSLDAGALGIICPMINTPEDAINFVGATRYAPEGHRSSGPTRALMVHGANYHEEANDKIISLAMIETVEALENVEKIAATEGLTGIYVGPSDLSISMGFNPGLDVYDDEPSTSSNPLFSLDNILLSPHIAGVTQEATIRMSRQAVQNVLDVFDDKVDPEVIINKNVL